LVLAVDCLTVAPVNEIWDEWPMMTFFFLFLPKYVTKENIKFESEANFMTIIYVG
jgi:hypothetical protein